MLKRMFALSDQGSRDLNKGIAATTLSNLCLIAPVSLLVMVIWELLNVISGQESSMRDHAALFICGTVVMFIIVFLTQWLQYNKTYTVAYENQRKTKLLLQIYNFINDFLPQRQVKSIGGLVEDQALRLSGQCPGDCHPLLFSTGQF